jgi:hypothetical protein
LIDLRFDETGKVSQRLLPAETARFCRNGVGYAFLHDVDVGADETFFSSTVTCISPGKLGSSNLSV